MLENNFGDELFISNLQKELVKICTENQLLNRQLYDIEELMDAVGELTASYDLHNAFDELVEVAENLKTECHCMGGVVKSTYLDAVSATAFDEKNGEQYADLLTNWIMTGHGIEEVNALEKEMDADEIYWVRRTL